VSGNPIHISTITEGEIYGDILIFGNKSRHIPGNIMTQVPSVIAMIPNELVEQYLLSNSQFLLNFLTLMSDKVYGYNMSSKLLSQDSIRDKILFFLKEERFKQNSNVIQLEMTKQELATKLHVQRPSLSRELINMRNEGLIDFNRKTITIKKDK
jgi:CRP-like cAMP-binding protein